MGRSVHSVHGNRDARARRVRRISALGVVAALLVPALSASGASGPTLQTAKVHGVSGVLVDSSSHTLYLLSSEKGATIHCRSGCLSSWPPLLVKDAVTAVSLGSGVKGTISFVSRGSTMKQVTFNSYPLYTFGGDSGPRQDAGEGIKADGGTWYAVRASATSTGSSALTALAATSSGGSSGGW